MTTLRLLLHTFDTFVLSPGISGPESPRIAKNNPESTLFRGSERRESTDSWPFAGTPRATSIKVTKVVILRSFLSSRTGIPRIRLPPRESHLSAIMSHIYPRLSNLYPSSSTLAQSSRVRTLAEERQLWPRLPSNRGSPRLPDASEPRTFSSRTATSTEHVYRTSSSCGVQVVYLGQGRQGSREEVYTGRVLHPGYTRMTTFGPLY